MIGSGLDVWEISEMLGDFGSVERLLRQTHLTERDVRLANAYTEAYPDEVEQARAENRRSTEELREVYPFVQVASRR